MIRTILNHILRIVFLILLQALVVSKIQALGGLILPWIYIFGILMLPFETPRWLILFISFTIGLIMDYFTGPMGLHTCACVALGYFMPLVQKLFSPREGYEVSQRPTIQSMGLTWYVTVAGICTLIHHAWLFIFEVFRFSGFFYTLLHILLSTIGTMILMIIGQYLIYNSKTLQQ
jgi:hypothetical protein